MRARRLTHDLEPWWDEIVRRADHRTELAARTRPSTTRPWVKDWNLIGVMGEFTFALEVRRKVGPENKDTVCDGGSDFVIDKKGINVKATRAPRMSFLHPLNDPLKADYYVQTIVTQDRKVGICVGVVTPAMIRAADRAPDYYAPRHPAWFIYWMDILDVPEWMYNDRPREEKRQIFRSGSSG